MCDSDTELTEQGIKEKKEREEREARWEKEIAESLEGDPCFSCDKIVQADELITMDGQDHCPYCGEGWVEMDNRDE